MSARDETEGGPFSLLLFEVLLLVPGLLWWGYAISALWGWFVAPLGLAAITAVHGAGLKVMTTTLTLRFRVEKKQTATERLSALIFTLIGPPILLGLGALLNLWMPS